MDAHDSTTATLLSDKLWHVQNFLVIWQLEIEFQENLSSNLEYNGKIFSEIGLNMRDMPFWKKNK